MCIRDSEKGAQNQFAAFIFQDIKAKRIAEDQAKALAEKAQQDLDAMTPPPHGEPADVQNEDTATRSNEVAISPEAPVVTPEQVPLDGSKETPQL